MDPRAPQEASHTSRDNSSSDSEEDAAAEGRHSASCSVSQQSSSATLTPQRSTSPPLRTRTRSRNTSHLQLVPIHQFSLRRLNQKHTIRLVGTHTEESSSDVPPTRSQQSLSLDNGALRPQQCLPLDNVVAVREVVEPAAKCQVLENVRGFVQEIEPNDKEKMVLENVRGFVQEIHPNDKEEKVYPYSEKAASELTAEVGWRNEKAVIEFKEFGQSKEEPSVTSMQEEDFPCQSDDFTTQSISDHQAKNAALADRFKEILEMFDKFTRNLENIDLLGPCEVQRGQSQKRRRDPSPKYRQVCMRAYASDESERQRPCKVRRSRYEEYYGKEKPMAADSSQEREEAQPAPRPTRPSINESFPYSLDKDERIDMATTMSGIALMPFGAKINESLEPVKELPVEAVAKPADCTTVSCQTSQLKFLVIPKTVEEVDDTIITIEEEEAHQTEAPIPAPRSKSEDRQLLVESRQPPTSATHLALDNVSLEPMERTYHTIHIDASSSPSSSVMRRPPLCTRLWNVLTDFCAAVCLCLQVNKECFFCLGFLVAFIISAIFLSVFFYRTMSAPPTYYTHPREIVDEPPPRPFEVMPSEQYLQDPIVLQF